MKCCQIRCENDEDYLEGMNDLRQTNIHYGRMKEKQLQRISLRPYIKGSNCSNKIKMEFK